MMDKVAPLTPDRLRHLAKMIDLWGSDSHGYHRSTRGGYVNPHVADAAAELVVNDLLSRKVSRFRLLAYDNSSAVLGHAVVREWCKRRLSLDDIMWISYSKHEEDIHRSVTKFRWDASPASHGVYTVFVDDDIITGTGVRRWLDDYTEPRPNEQVLGYCISLTPDWIDPDGECLCGAEDNVGWDCECEGLWVMDYPLEIICLRKQMGMTPYVYHGD